MNFYKVTKISILLISGVLLACSSDEQQTTNINNHNSTASTQSNNQTRDIFQGMTVHIDPASGKFLDTPPTDYVAPKKVSNNNNLNVNSGQDPIYVEKQSTTPGGGTYMKMPNP